MSDTCHVLLNTFSQFLSLTLAVSTLLQVSCMKQQSVCHTNLNNLCGKAVHKHENYHLQPIIWAFKCYQ